MECAMKKLFFSLVVFSVLLLVGCQENSITDPNQNSTDVNKNGDSSPAGVLKLQRNLQSPYRVFNSYFVISGAIDYQLDIQYLDPIPPNSQQIISLQLSIDAKLTNVCTVCSPLSNETSAGIISGELSDVINISDDGQHTVSKTFAIRDREDGMVLKCSFFVTTNSVTVDRMWLELPEGIADNSSL